MTNDQKLQSMALQIGTSENELFDDCLRRAKSRILNRRFPYGTELTEVEAVYDELQIELAICIYNKRGAEGESSHGENGVNRSYRSEDEILKDITPFAGVPKL